MTPNEINGDVLAQHIYDHLKSELQKIDIPELLSGKPQREWSRCIKEIMGDLGKAFGYKVSAAGYPHADHGEFLYDMIWYKLDSEGFVLNSFYGDGVRIQHRGV